MSQALDYGFFGTAANGRQVVCGGTGCSPIPDHRQFESAWSMLGYSELSDLGLMDVDAHIGCDFEFSGSNSHHPHFDLHMEDVLDDFPVFDEIEHHDRLSNSLSLTSQSSLQEMLPSSSMGRSTVPSSSPYCGEYGFEVAVEKQPKTTKSASWLFVNSLNKLFVMRDKPCPFLFKTLHPPPFGSIIRVLPVYPTADHVAETVTRCPTHACDRKVLEDASLVQHLIVSEHQMAEHIQDPYSNRLNVIIPYEEPQVGAEWVTSLFQFKCLGSCQKINDRRSWKVIFTLECDGFVLGRQVVMVHCCSSPGRDGLREEQKRFGTAAVPVRKTGLLLSDLDATGLRKSLTFTAKQRKFEFDVKDVYLLRVRGRERFELLAKLRDALHMSTQVNQDAFVEFRQKLREVDDRVRLEEQSQRQEMNPKSSSSSTMSSGKTKKKRAVAVVLDTKHDHSLREFGIS